MLVYLPEASPMKDEKDAVRVNQKALKFVRSSSAFSAQVCYTRWRCIWTFIIALAVIFIIPSVQEVWPSINQGGDDT
jgi:hypothetical protein